MNKHKITKLFILFSLLASGCVHEKTSLSEEENTKAEIYEEKESQEDAKGTKPELLDYIIAPQFESTGAHFIDGLMLVEKKSGDKSYKGFIDTEGSLVIEPIFKDTKHYIGMSSASSGFSEGLAPVKQDGKWGYINRQGDIIIDFAYDDAWLFEEERAVVKVGEKYGLINLQGSLAVSTKYDQLFYQQGVGIVEVDGKWGFIDKDGDWLLKPTYDNIDLVRNSDEYEGMIVVMDEDLEGLVKIENVKIETIIQPKYTKIFPYREEKASFVRLIKGQDGTYTTDKDFGYVDLQGNELFRWEHYEGDFGQLSEGLIAVQDETEKWGFIDLEKNLVIPYTYDSASNFYDGIASVTINDKTGIINKSGEWLIKPRYREVTPIANFFIVKDDEGDFLIDRNGRQLSKTYDEVGRGGDGTLMAVQTDEKVGFINQKGDEVLAPQYDECKYFVFWDGYAAVREDRQWFYIDEKGRRLGSQSFEDVDLFKDSYAAVKKDGKWGVINEKQELVIPYSFDEITVFEQGLIRVFEDGKYGFLKLH